MELPIGEQVECEAVRTGSGVRRGIKQHYPARGPGGEAEAVPHTAAMPREAWRGSS